MNITPFTIEESGPGIDLSNQSDGIAITMSDPVTDFEYARNAVTLTYDLSGAETARLCFSALEFGDEPHYPKDEFGIENRDNVVGFGPLDLAQNFDGVAISVDGVDWYEIQDLRSLRSDKFTAYDLDLLALLGGLGLAVGSAVRIRFCQYDNNPAPKDGIFLQGIQVTGDLRPAILHLMMDDNAANPTVTDASANGNDQTFLDPGGNPNTDAHSVPGVVATALAFDGVDDQINLGATVDAALTAGQDFAVAFWWARGSGNDENYKRIFDKTADNGSFFAFNVYSSGSGIHYTQFNFVRSHTPDDRSVLSVANVGYDWNHYVLQRRGGTVEVWANGALQHQDTTAGNDRDFSGTADFILGGMGSGYATGTMDEFRVYDRALLPEEIVDLSGR